MKNNHCDYHRHNPEIMIIMIMLLRVGTRRYMAPEILDNTLKLDSFESFKVSFKMIYVDNIICDVHHHHHRHHHLDSLDNQIMNAGGGHLLPGAGFLGGLQENLQWGEKGLITTNVIISVITILVIS